VLFRFFDGFLFFIFFVLTQCDYRFFLFFSFLFFLSLSFSPFQAKAEDAPVPLYRYFNKVDTDHYYMTERVVTQGSRVAEGVECLVLGPKATERGTVPLYSYYHAATRDHMLTTDLTRLGVAGAGGWKFLGAIGRVWPNTEAAEIEEASDGKVVAVRRFFNHLTGDHLLTTQDSEDSHAWYGWAYQGISFYCHTTAQPGTVPLKLYYNAAVSDHIVSADPAMLDGAATGWSYESSLCYVSLKPATGLVPLRRYFSATLQDHYYTTDGARLGTDPAHPKMGWAYQGIEAYVLPHPDHTAPALPPTAMRASTPVYAWWNGRYRSHAVVADKAVEARLESSVGLRTGDGAHGWSRAVLRIGGKPNQPAFHLYAKPGSDDHHAGGASAPGSAPLYAFFDHAEQDFFYTTRFDEGAERSPGQWRSERGVVGYVNLRQTPGTVPLYRYYNATVGDTVVTTELFPAAMPYKLEGVLGFVPSERVARYASHVAGSHDANLSTMSASLPRNLRLAPLYQFLDAATGGHVMTAAKEFDAATDDMVAKTGHVAADVLDSNVRGATHYFQGAVAYCSRKRITGSVPLYAFRASTGQYAYSTAKDEFAQWGSVPSVACYVFDHHTAATVALHRWVSRNGSGDHVYATDKGELSDNDWKYQGIQAYVYPAAVETRQPDDTSHPVTIQI
jgi:hypothetical protein